MKAWDAIGKKDVEVGTTRWVVEWYLWHEDADQDDPELDPIEDAVCMCRAFPTRPLAEAFGRRVSWEVWGPTVLEEEFHEDYVGPEGRFGSWEQRGERDDVDDCQPCSKRPLTAAEVSTNSPEIVERLRGDRPDPPQTGTVSSSEIAAHPNLSLSPRDYLPKRSKQDD